MRDEEDDMHCEISDEPVVLAEVKHESSWRISGHASQKEMQPREHREMTFYDLMQKRLLVIPLYQRAYEWKRYLVEQLWDSINRTAYSSHALFLGQITLCNQASAVEDDDDMIVSDSVYPVRHEYLTDGQQRITTLLALIAVICPFVEDKEEREAIIRMFISVPTRKRSRKKETHRRLVLHSYLQERFCEFLDHASTNMDLMCVNREWLPQSKKLYETFFYFNCQIRHRKNTSRSVQEFQSYITDILCTIQDGVRVLVTTSYETYAEQMRSFIAMNQLRQLPSLDDLISYSLQQAIVDTDNILKLRRNNNNDSSATAPTKSATKLLLKSAEVWAHIGSQMVRYDLGKDSDYDQFFRAVWQSITSSVVTANQAVTLEQMNACFRADMNRPLLTLNRLKDYIEYFRLAIRTYCDLYGSKRDSTYCHVKDIAVREELRDLSTDIKRIDARDCVCPLAIGIVQAERALFDGRDAGANRHQHLRNILKAVIRRTITGSISALGKRNSSRTCKTASGRALAKSGNNNPFFFIRYVMNDMKGKAEKYSTRTSFMSYLTSSTVDDWKYIKYLLYSYELHLREDATDTATIRYEDLTVEHIMPSEYLLDPYWILQFGTVAECEKNVHLLGNLLLIPKKSNSALGARSFTHKRDHAFHGYRNSAMQGAQQLKDVLEWTPRAIATRQAQIATWAADHFELSKRMARAVKSPYFTTSKRSIEDIGKFKAPPRKRRHVSNE